VMAAASFPIAADRCFDSAAAVSASVAAVRNFVAS
jgi:hypothetical protein